MKHEELFLQINDGKSLHLTPGDRWGFWTGHYERMEIHLQHSTSLVGDNVYEATMVVGANRRFAVGQSLVSRMAKPEEHVTAAQEAVTSMWEHITQKVAEHLFVEYLAKTCF